MVVTISCVCVVRTSLCLFNDEKFAIMMLQDGCLCLYMIETLVHMREENLRMICGHLGFLASGFIFPDMFLLENQIPFSLLQVLLSFKYQEYEGLRIIKKFLKMGFSGKFWIGVHKEVAGDENEQPPVHLLDLLQREISRCGFQHDQCSRFSNIWKSNLRRYHQDLTDYLESFCLANKLKESFRSVTELKAGGSTSSQANPFLFEMLISNHTMLGVTIFIHIHEPAHYPPYLDKS